MDWFDEQIRERARSDEDILEDSLVRVAGSVLGGRASRKLWDERQLSREALDDILKYYHYKPVEIPNDIRDTGEQLEYVLRPLGIMTRSVLLPEGWQKNASGPMLAKLKKDGTAVALIPGYMYGYRYRDPDTGDMKRVDRESSRLFAEEALCLYRPLPMKSLGIPDLLAYMKGCISEGDVILIVLATLAVTLVGMIEPRVYRAITGPVLESRNTSILIGMAVFLLTSAFASQLLGAARSLLTDRIQMKTSLAVESAVMMRVLSMPLGFFREYSSGEMSSRTEAVNTLCGMILGSIFSVGLGALMSLLYVTQIFRFTPILVVPSLIIILASTLLSLSSSLLRIGISREQMQLSAKENGLGFAMISGIRKIRLSGAEKRAFARWAGIYAKRTALTYNPPTFLMVNPVLMSAVTLVGNIVLYWCAVRAHVTPADYFAFSAAYGRVMAAFSALAGIAVSAAGIKPVLEMAEPLLSTEPEVTEEKEVITRLSGAIEMSHVSFRYSPDTPYVLDDLSLKVKAGDYIAIVGRTGCGKSTLIRLLLGFEKPEKGAVYYDGRDLITIDPRSLRRKMGVVTQNGDLFQGDIFSNIAISAPQMTLDDAWEAAETAGIAQDIREMPMGMFTVISEGSGGISGGQRQRLMIARAIAPKPKILIFDEATSALDNRTQKQVSEALDRLRCTRIVIAHRLSTIKNCGRILVMDGGTIVEEGTYDELLARNGVFADLVSRQRLETGDAS